MAMAACTSSMQRRLGTSKLIIYLISQPMLAAGTTPSRAGSSGWIDRTNPERAGHSSAGSRPVPHRSERDPNRQSPSEHSCDIVSHHMSYAFAVCRVVRWTGRSGRSAAAWSLVGGSSPERSIPSVADWPDAAPLPATHAPAP